MSGDSNLVPVGMSTPIRTLSIKSSTPSVMMPVRVRQREGFGYGDAGTEAGSLDLGSAPATPATGWVLPDVTVGIVAPGLFDRRGASSDGLSGRR